MAVDPSIDGLYIRLGLALSELETDFITASQTVAANISRLNREADLIRLRAEVEIAGLDEVNDAERILQIRTDALNQRMAIQRDRVRLLEAAYRDVARTQGETSVAAQRAAVRLERERLSLANLERELRNLSETQEETNGSLTDLSSIAAMLPPQLKMVAAGATAVATGVGAAGAATKELLDEFRELQKQSYELNMPFEKTRDFLRQLKLGGGDIGDFEGYIRGITDAYVKGEYDDPEFVALRKYGAVITDATGRLKDFKDLTEEVYQAFKKADAAGEGVEFLQLTGGEAGVRDAIQFFKRYEEALEDAKRIFKAKIDDGQLHELDRAFGRLEEQSKELKNALGDIFVPAAQAAAENFFDVIHDGTQFLTENKDEIQRWGFVAAETFDTIANKLSELTSYSMPDTGDEKVDRMLDGLQWRMAEFNDQALWGDESKWSKIFSKLPSDILESLGILDRATEKQLGYNDAVEESKKVTDGFSEALTDEAKAALRSSEALSQYAIKRVQGFRDELEDLKIELEFGDNEFEKAKAQLDLWRDRESTYKLYVSPKEGRAIDELYSAKLEQIEQERADRVAEIRRAVDAEFKTSLENQIDKINEEKDAWISAGMAAAEAFELAQRRIDKAIEETADSLKERVSSAVDEIKGTLQSVEDKIFELDNSQYEIDLRRIKQDYLKTAASLQARGAFDEQAKARLDYMLRRQKYNLDARARESREKGGDYTKKPEGAGRTANVQIEVNKLMVDESRIQASIADILSKEERKTLAFLQSMTQARIADILPKEERETFTSLQSMTTAPTTAEITVEPLNNIGTKLDAILTALSDREPPQVNISSPIHNNLGGAYVFDEAMKNSLVNDITDKVVTAIKDAVTQATSKTSYGYSA